MTPSRLATIALGAALVLGAVAASSAMATEKPAYDVARADGAIEIRDYPKMLLAEVTVSGERSEAANAAFRILADFIFGANRPAERIAMTAPVTQAEKGEKIAMTAPVTQAGRAGMAGPWTVAFMMPSKYSRASLPQPTDARIRIVEQSPRRMAAIRFSGRWTDSRFAAKRDALAAWLAANGYRTRGAPVFAYYDPPFMPSLFRRNEVLWELAP